MTKRLLSIVSENWDTFSSSLDFNKENKFENYLLMINKLEPSIKLVDSILNNHNHDSRISYIKIGNPKYHSLIKMRLMNYDSKNEYFCISEKGKEISKGYYNFNHPEAKGKEKPKITIRITGELKVLIKNEEKF